MEDKKITVEVDNAEKQTIDIEKTKKEIFEIEEIKAKIQMAGTFYNSCLNICLQSGPDPDNHHLPQQNPLLDPDRKCQRLFVHDSLDRSQPLSTQARRSD